MMSNTDQHDNRQAHSPICGNRRSHRGQCRGATAAGQQGMPKHPEISIALASERFRLLVESASNYGPSTHHPSGPQSEDSIPTMQWLLMSPSPQQCRTAKWGPAHIAASEISLVKGLVERAEPGPGAAPGGKEWHARLASDPRAGPRTPSHGNGGRPWAERPRTGGRQMCTSRPGILPAIT